MTHAPIRTPQVGDRYHRKDISATVEVEGITETHVQWTVTQDGQCWSKNEPIEVFIELERKSLEWGAVFEPAKQKCAN